MERNEQDIEAKHTERPGERPLKEQSPDEAKRTVKEKVSRGVATVAGALEGFVQQMRKNDVPEKSKQAVEKVGETTRKVSEATRREGREVKESMKGSGSSLSRQEEAVPVTGTAHREPSGQQTEFSRGLGSEGESRRPGQSSKKSDDLTRR